MNSGILERLERIKKQEIPTGYEKGAIHLKPKEWLENSLDKIIISSDYGTSESTNNELGIPVLRMGNMNNGKIDISDLVYLELNKEQFEKLKLNKGDILFNRTNSYDLVGKVSLFDIDGDYVCASYIVRFKIDNSLIDSRYVSYFMNLPKSQEYIKMLATKGVQQANVNPTTLKKYFKISFPENLDEQKYILDILDTWEQSLKLKEKLLEEKQKQKKGLMERLLTGKVRLIGFDSEWKEISLDKILLEKNEVTTVNNQYPVLTSSRQGIFLQSEYFGKQVASQYNVGYKIIKKYEFTYRAMSDDGKFTFNQLLKHEIGIVSPAYSVFKVRDNSDDTFIKEILNSDIFTRHLAKEVQGGTRLALKFKSLSKIKLKLPEKKEQVEIAKILKASNYQIDLLQKEIELLKEQKKGLMQLLLTGLVRVKCN